MRMCALLARKGGTGKTTLAVHLAVLAGEGGRKVLLVDCDPQKSASDWWKARDGDAPRLVTCQAKRLPEVLAAAEREKVDLVVVDTRPSMEADTAEIGRLADLVVIPTRAGILDLRAIAPTVEVIKGMRKASMIVLNAVPPPRGDAESGLSAEARRALAGYGLPVGDVAIGNRVAFAHALIDGRSVTEFEPDGKASTELRRLFTSMEKVLWPSARR
jgi:chromosome partitioning protein